jgi:Protein of unknown function (DUF2752)
MTAAPAPTQLPAPPARPTRSRATRWLCASGMAAACAGVATYIYTVDPNVSKAYPQCPLKAITGLDCPGCGGLRATHSLLHGDIAGAFDHNVIAAIFVPVMAYLIVRWVLQQFDISVPAIRLPKWAAVAVPILILAFTIVRNINWGPFWYLNSAA